MKRSLQGFNMDLTIIIVNFNTPKLLRECLESIKSSKIRSSYEVIVVDNGSEERSVELIETLVNKKLVDNAFYNKNNQGFSKANNKGIRASQGKYKLLLNSDTLVKDDAIDELVDFAESSEDAGVIGSKLLNMDGSVQPSCFNFSTIERAIRQYWLGTGAPLDKFAPQGDRPIEVDSVVGASFMITPKAIERVGLLDERYFMFFEDQDYCRKVWRSGLKVYYLPSSEIVHLHGQSGRRLANPENQWKRLIPSSKIYHGTLKHYLLNFILWSGQKFSLN